MLNETLADVEADLRDLRKNLEAKSLELAKSEEESRHLVRINEQRHQQILCVQTAIKRMEKKAKDIILKQVMERAFYYINIRNLRFFRERAKT